MALYEFVCDNTCMDFTVSGRIVVLVFYAFVILNAIALIRSCNCINSFDLHFNL